MAVNDPTTNFGWDIPNVGADVGAWGSVLNAIFGEDSGPTPGIDAILGDVKDLAEAALPATGGDLDGNLNIDGVLSFEPQSQISLSTGNNNNLGSGEHSILQLHASTSGTYDVTGFAGGSPGRLLIVRFSTGNTGNEIRLIDTTASSPGNRLNIAGGNEIVVTPRPQVYMFVHLSGAWQVINQI